MRRCAFAERQGRSCGVRGAAGLILAATLAGCSTYEVRVNNKSSEPVYAQLYKHDGLHGTEPAGNGARIGPSDSGWVRASTRPRWDVHVAVDSLGNPGYPAKLDLRKGLTVVEVSRQTPDGRLQIRELDRR